MDPTQRHQSMSREGLRKMPSQFQAKTKLIVHPGTSGALSPAPPAAACLLFTALEAGRGARVSRCSSHRRREAAGAQPEDRFQFGSLPRIYAAPVHVSPQGRQEEPREVWPPGSLSESAPPPLEVAGPGSLETAHPAQRSGLGGGYAVRWELRVGAGMQGKGGCQGAQSRDGRKGWGTGLRRVPHPAAQWPHATSCSPW